jgi:hypothetical protein
VPQAETRDDPLPLVRTTSRVTIIRGIACLGLAVGSFLYYGRGGPVWIAIYGAFLICVIMIFVGSLHYRLEIGEEGIRRRTFFRTVFVPWDQVDDLIALGGGVRALQVKRRSGMPLMLWGLPVAPLSGKPGMDALLAAMRERANIPEPQGD